MRESQMAGQLRMRWVPVVDDSGRTHMEARWEVPTMAPAMTQAAVQGMAPAGPGMHASHAA